jgi:biotin synthase
MSLFRALPRSLPLRSYSTVQSHSPPSWASKTPAVLQAAANAPAPRMSWTRDEIQEIYSSPLNELTYASVPSLASNAYYHFPTY